MKKLINLLAVLTAVIVAAGCSKSADSKSADKSGLPGPGAPAAITPARQTSFAEVTSQLDPGGSLYAYLSTDQWLAGLSTNIAELRSVLQDIPDLSSGDRQQVDRVLGMVTSTVRESGIEGLTGVGLSGVQVTPELYRTKLILHHKAGAGQGFLWNMMGEKPHALEGVNLLSTNVALATFGDCNVKLLWDVVQQQLGASGVPELSDNIRRWPALFEQQTRLSWEKVLDSLGGEAGLIVTLNDQNKISLPVPGQPLEMSEPGLMLVIKVNDDLIYERIAAELKKTQMTQFTEEKGLKMAVMALPVPLPMDLKVTVASSAGYLFIASSPALVRDALAVRAGSQPGLRQTAAFAGLMRYLPNEGNHFFYLDRRLSETVRNIQQQALNSGKGNAGQMKLLQKYLFGRPANCGMSVSAHTSTGWQTVSIGNQDASASMVAAPAVAATAVGAAMVLPALAKAKERAQSINCVNNLKQIGLACRIWAGDNDDKFPFNVGTAKGGTLELCDRGGDGYDRNSSRHFRVMSNELNTPKILVCPSDSSKHAAMNFGQLQPENVSYQVRSGPNINDSNPNEVLVYCPIHHHILRVDGSVEQGKRK
jgi:hypothetical protein